MSLFKNWNKHLHALPDYSFPHSCLTFNVTIVIFCCKWWFLKELLKIVLALKRTFVDRIYDYDQQYHNNHRFSITILDLMMILDFASQEELEYVLLKRRPVAHQSNFVVLRQ